MSAWNSVLVQVTILLQVDTQAFEETFVPAILKSLEYFAVEFQVVIAAMVILLADLCIPLRYSKHLAWVAVAACVLPLGTVQHHFEETHSLFLGMVAMDPFANFFKIFFLLGSIPVILLSYVSKQLEGRRMGEYYFILLSSVFGAMLLASSTHFLMIFLSLELLSICSYILVGYVRRDRKGAEAALKYIIYGSVAAAMMAYGFSLWYGLTGSADITQLGALLIEGNLQTSIAVTLASLMLIFLGFAYKMSTIPMHFWAPDVYEGAPTAITAFLSVLSKAAGFALAIRFFHGLAGSIGGLEANAAATQLWQYLDWRALLILLSILTMTFGNLAALWQTNLKRLLAYSSIAHAGYLMMGLTLLGRTTEYTGPQTIAYYLWAYLAMNFGAFAVVILLENRLGSAHIDAYRGLGRRAPFLAASLTVFLFSLIGVPPTSGFFGKFHLLMGVVSVPEWPYYTLATAAIINTAISAYYYLRIAKTMYFESSDVAGAVDDGAVETPALGRVVVLGMVILTFYLFFMATELLTTTLNLELHL